MIRNTAISAQLRLNGHTYYKKDTNNGNVYWRCVLSKTGQCGATAITRQTRSAVKVIKEGVHGHSCSESDEQASEAEYDAAEPCEPDRANDDHSDSDMTEDQSGDSSSEESEQEGKQWEFWEEETDEEDIDEEEMEGIEESEVDSEEEGGSDDEDEDGEVDNIRLLLDQVDLHKKALVNLCVESGTVREAILKEADKDLICFLCEICWNFLNGYFDLKKHEKNILKLYKEDIRVLADKDVSWTNKKECLVECANDHFIPILLNVLLPHLN